MLHIFNKVKREEKVPKNRFKSGKSILFVRDTMKKSFDLLKIKKLLKFILFIIINVSVVKIYKGMTVKPI